MDIWVVQNTFYQISSFSVSKGGVIRASITYSFKSIHFQLCTESTVVGNMSNGDKYRSSYKELGVWRQSSGDIRIWKR